jgi:hypothetical protein
VRVRDSWERTGTGGEDNQGGLADHATDVIPAKAEIHFDFMAASNRTKIKMDPRFRGDDDLVGPGRRAFTLSRTLAAPALKPL